MVKQGDPFKTKAKIDSSLGELEYHSLAQLSANGFASVSELPFSIRVLLECALRNQDGYVFTDQHVQALANWDPKSDQAVEIPFMPARVILQDFTGVPAVVDLAAMRSAMVRLGGDPKRINPQVPVDLVIDHSVQVDHFGSDQALGLNVDLEFARNQERYEFLRWGQEAFDNFRVVPPNTGIVHQVNLEYLAMVAQVSQTDEGQYLIPDSLVGTDSHTTMINGLGVLGWGVGGIEAEAVMLGQPIYMLIPKVIGFEITGSLPAGATATDMVLMVTEQLRNRGVVGCFVEFFGEGLRNMSLPDRATIANMAPEYGATMGFFPVDEETMRYLRLTGRDPKHVDLVEAYYRAQGLFYQPGTNVRYTDTLTLDLGDVVPSLAGPKRPQDRIALTNMKRDFQDSLTKPAAERGFALSADALGQTADVIDNGRSTTITHGDVVIAAITSCTNTSNPSVMLGAGVLAKKAVEKGLSVKPHVKTSMAPGSRVVSDYLSQSGLDKYLEQLGFHTVGYGCTTCIGNSGPLPEPVVAAIQSGSLVVSSVLSGNRNFEGRINPHVKANYLASPPLVVAYALAGSTQVDLSSEPLGQGSDGGNVYLKDVWPSAEEVASAMKVVSEKMFKSQYDNVFSSNDRWNAININASDVYDWNAKSTYIQEPPFFVDLAAEPAPITDIVGARVLALLGDSVTTDHISPAGAIPADGPAGHFLQANNVGPRDFNSFGSRRGNDRIMTRGTFSNIRIKNQLVPGTEGGFTEHFPTQEQTSIFEAAQRYANDNTPLIVLAGTDYGMGSSRDWAAKGTMLLGVRAVIAKSFERIHRSNLVGMGVLPLQFDKNQDAKSLGLAGDEMFDITGLGGQLKPFQTIEVTAKNSDGKTVSFSTTLRIDTPVELDYYRHGGILHMVLRKMLGERS